MGGLGSGPPRHYFLRKETTGDYRQADVRTLRQMWIFGEMASYYTTYGNADDAVYVSAAHDRARLRHRSRSTKTTYAEERLPLEWTPCNYGGARCWFVCPGCSSRVAVLYVKRGKSFRCRRCHSLSYESQRLDPATRSVRRAQRNRLKMGASTNLFLAPTGRPRRMHRTTWQRLLDEERRHQEQLQRDVDVLAQKTERWIKQVREKHSLPK